MVMSVNPEKPASTSSIKNCLLDQLRSAPLIEFSPQRITHVASILSQPLHKQRWNIQGQGQFKTASGVLSKPTTVMATYIMDRWYFIPPSYDREWERRYVSLETPSSDLVRFVELLNPQDSPVSIEDLTITIHKEYRSLRDMRFVVRNKTAKTIRNIRYRVTGGTTVTVLAGVEIEPGGAQVLEVTVSAYSYFCQGEQKRRLFVDRVKFADKREWNIGSRAH
jgi:hypothetical protein